MDVLAPLLQSTDFWWSLFSWFSVEQATFQSKGGLCLEIINPYGFTSHFYANDYDLWKVGETEEQLIYHLRLLKNHELRSISLKMLPGPGIKVIHPN